MHNIFIKIYLYFLTLLSILHNTDSDEIASVTEIIKNSGHHAVRPGIL